jgi:hypothetical protein
MAHRTERAVLNHLIETFRDAERGFTIAAHEVRAREPDEGAFDDPAPTNRGLRPSSHATSSIR